MERYIDSGIVICYFLLVFAAGYFISRAVKKEPAEDFITDGRTMSWYKTGLTVLAMGYDPGIIAHAGLGFLWGMFPMQWLGVHVWFTAWFAGMFLVPVYWRSRITTTPELLERRFNVYCRSFFAVVMIAVLIVTLAFGVYLGSLLLKDFLGWSIWMSVFIICAVAAFYVIRGGMHTVLSIDFAQSIFLIAAQLVIGGMALYKLGGLSGLASITLDGKAGNPMPSTIPVSDWSLTTTNFYPMQAILTWALVSGTAWLSINYGMVQRLLAAKSEKDAQQGLLLFSVLASIACVPGYLVGVYMRTAMPDILPDESYPTLLLTMFPVGVRGVLIAGLMAALLSSIDGMFTATGALFSEDIYRRFINPNATGARMKKVTRIVQGICVASTLLIVPFVLKAETALQFLQSFYGDVLGVVGATYIAGMFFTRTTPRAAFTSMVTGTILAVCLDVFTAFHFAYVGFFSFLYTLFATLLLSLFEKPVSAEKLDNLTIHTLSDAKAPFVGLQAWPGLWKWALGLAVGWFALSALWEWYVWVM